MWIYILFAFLAIVLIRTAWRRWKYDLHKIPCPPGLPILGNVLSLASREGKGELTQFRGRWWHAHGHPKLFKIDVLGASIVYVRDAEVAKSLLASHTPPFKKGLALAKHLYKLIGNDPTVTPLFLTSELTPYAKGMRRVYANWLQSQNLKRLFPKVKETVSKMMEIIDKQRRIGAVDFQELSVRTILDVIGIAAFDVNLGGLDGSRKVYDLLIEGGYVMREFGFNPIKAFVYEWCPESALVKKQADVIHRLTREWDSLMSQLLLRENCQQQSPTDFWDHLTNFVDPETNKPLSYAQRRAECASVILAAMDTTGHQIAWILALLASNPRVTSKLLEQLTSLGLFGVEAREICYEDIANLTYLTAVVKEGMRIASVAPASLFRCLPRDMTILGYRIPKDTLIQAPSNRWLDADDEWKDPLCFRPERWLEPGDVRSKYFLGFSFGQRDCIGQRLATLEMRLAIAQLIKKYDLSLTVPYEELRKNTRFGVVVEAKDGIWIQATPRDMNSLPS